MLFLKEKSPRQTAGTLEGWQKYCREVAAAAEMLRDIASRAAGVAEGAVLLDGPFERLTRDAGLGSPAPDPQARTYATMMLGPFAALEGLRRKLADT